MKPRGHLVLRAALLALVAFGMATRSAAAAAGTSASGARSGDAGGTLQVVATAHLDTQWRWTIQNTIEEYIPATFRDNVALFEKYPGYVFSFEGAFRYMLFKEYYPEEYERVKPYVAEGRWRVAGGWVDAVDVNIPSFESLVRHSLYGNGFFKREFGKTSRDIFLPDCFGFSYALPSIAAHCGIRSFSTQKLDWGSAYGVPFDIGLWEGVDGSTLIAALRPGDYVTQIRSDLSRDSTWIARVAEQKRVSGLPAAYMYFGTGDTGGSPDSTSVDWLQKSMRGNGPLRVQSVGSDELVDLVAAAGSASLPRYRGELLMTRHGVGCYTSQAVMKRWNRRNELLADAAERAAVIADDLGRSPYPRKDLGDIWVRFLWHQFHDDVTGTSIPAAYEFSWNDEILCQNRSSGLLEHAVGATTPALDTRVKGVPLVVYNPLAMEREDIVEATVVTGPREANHVRVIAPDGKDTPSQVIAAYPDSLRILFLARVPSVGYAVYDVRPDRKADGKVDDLAASDNTLENARYRVRLNAAGDVTSIFDKKAARELLAAPIQWQLFEDEPRQWSAWEIQYEDLVRGPRQVIGGPATMKVVESGPARVAIEVTRQSGSAAYRTVVRLAAGGAGDRVTFDSDVDWYEKKTLLKAAFSLTSPNDSVTYDLGLGAIARGLNRKELYEVPGHQWADMTSPSGDYGVAVLNDCKYGWDHPDGATLRLTLLHTPGVVPSWNWLDDQQTLDHGHHRFSFAVTGHRGDWRDGAVVSQAARMNQPLQVFQVPKHDGSLGRRYAFVTVASPGPARGEPSPNPGIFVNALKKAEDSDEIVIRVRETNGRGVERAEIRFARPLVGAREITGAEEPRGKATIDHGMLVTALSPYQPRAFAVKLAPASAAASPAVVPVALRYDVDAMSLDADRKDGDLDGSGNTMAGELLPDTLSHHDIPFVFGPRAPGQPNAVTCRGQKLAIPAGDWNKLYALVAAVNGPAEGRFTVRMPDDSGSLSGGDQVIPTTVWVQDWVQPIAQWYDRLVAGSLVDRPTAIAPAYINRAPVAWYGTHRHTATGTNEAYRETYLFLVALDLPKSATAFTLPSNDRIKLFAATVARTEADDIRPAHLLYDDATATVARIQVTRRTFIDSTEVRLLSPNPGADLRYTVDGSDPTDRSPRYTGPITLRETTTLKARAVLPGVNDAHIASINVTRQVPRTPVRTREFLSGLRCRYYEGEWSSLPSFDTLRAAREIVVDTIVVPPFARDELYALRFDGYVEVPAEGMYEFFIESDDGSALYVADSLVVDNDGLHGAEELSGEIALQAGLHRFRVVMFQKKGDEALAVKIAGPRLEKQVITRRRLRR